MARKYITFLLIATMFLIAGCEPSVPSPTQQTTTENKTTKTSTETTEKLINKNKKSDFIVYKFSKSGTTLMAENISASKLTTFDNLHVLNYLLKNDKLFDPKAQVIKIDIQDNLAKVNFNKEFKNIKVGGSNNELLIVASIVNTLVDNDERIKKVQLLIDGKTVETLLGHVDISEPLVRMPELIKK